MRNNKKKLILDTNIFVKGIIFPNKNIDCGDLILIIYQLLEEDKIELVFSQETIGELIYVMKNFVKHNVKDEDKQLEIMQMLINLIFTSYTVNTEDTKLKVECLDPTDNMFLKCAVQSKANYIISNDIKSGLHKIKDKFKVVTAEEFMKLFK